MKAVVYEGPNQMVYKDVPDVSPKAGEVKLRVKACGICGSDVHGFLGLTGRRIEPMIMGHEFAGEITALGEGVTEYETGSRAAVYPVAFCGQCDMCKKGDVHLCLNKRAFGVLEVDGAFAEYICVPAKCCFPIEDHVSHTIGSLMEPLAVAYRGVAHAGDLEGKNVLVVGTGTIGLLALACVKMKNPAKIIVSDLNDSRLEVAKNMGCHVVINPGREDFKKRILEETHERGIDVAIEAVGAAPTVQQAMSSLCFAGTAVWIGNSKRMIDINMQEIVTRELSVQGSFLYGYEEFRQVVSLLNERKLNVEPLISEEITLEQVPEYFEKLAHTPGNLIKVVVTDK